MSSAMIFDSSKKNFYSITPLIATIDEDPRLTQLDVILQQNLDAKFIKKQLNKYDKIVVGFSFRTAQLSEIYLKMKTIYSSLDSTELKRITFIAGGSHPSGSPLTTLKAGFDISFIGEAEYSLPLFLSYHQNEDDVFKTPGIAFLEKNSELVETKKPLPIELDDYPFISKKRGLYPPLEISRGCVFGCTFCQVPTLFKHRTRHRTVEKILEVVNWMARRKLDDIRFITPNSFGYMSSKPKEVNQEAIIKLLSSIKSVEGISNVYYGTFPGEVRPETVSKELMDSIKPYVSNTRISIGLQSGSDEVLNAIHRGHTVDEGLKAINVVIESGFTPVVDIIIGLPNASEEDEMKTIEVIENLGQKNAIFRAHIFMPLPGTPLENTLFTPVSSKIRKKLGKLNSKGKIEGNWSNQEKYAEDAWKTGQKLLSLPQIKR